MKTSLKTLKPSHLALAAALAFGGASAYAADAAPAATKPVPGANANVQAQTRKQTDTLIQEAVTALRETESALQLLEQGKKKEALEAMARATGKLEIIVARDAKLALAPVDVVVRAHEFLGTAKDIERVVKEAKSALGDQRVQDARRLLEPLASEITIEVVNLPMATYPAAIKEAARLTEKDQIADAKKLLATTLNTLVVQQTAIPIPLLHVEDALKEAEQLAQKASRTADEEKKLADLLRFSSEEVARAAALGYGSKDEHKTFQKEIKELRKKTEGGKSGSGWFEGVKASLAKLFKSSQNGKANATQP